MSRVALVTDEIGPCGGAERILEALLEMFPNAHVFALTYRPATGPLRLPAVVTAARKTLSRLDQARRFAQVRSVVSASRSIEAFDLSGYDLVISASAGFAVGARKAPGALHVAYVHSLLEVDSGFGRLFRAGLLAWERRSFSKGHTDLVLADSARTASLVRGRTGREANGVLPGWVDDAFWIAGERRPGRHFVTVGPITEEKRMDVILSAFRQTGEPLLVLGDGPERRRLRSKTPHNVEWLGAVSREALRDILLKSRAFVTASAEGFQLAAAEASAIGVPVIGGSMISAEELASDLRAFRASEPVSGLTRQNWQIEFQKWIHNTLAQRQARVTSERSSSGIDARDP